MKLSVKVIFYDQYYDIPTRGVVELNGTAMPFTAELNQYAEDDSWESGIPALVRLFAPTESLIVDYQFISDRFKKWRSAGIGEHPISSDPQYHAVLKRIEHTFAGFVGIEMELSGVFSNDRTNWIFTPVPNDNIRE